MQPALRSSFGLSILAISLAAPALADVTAAELWDEWQEMSEGFGQTITAETVTTLPNGLRLGNVTSALVQEELTLTGEIDEITLIENGDGSVSVEMSEVYDLTFTFEPDASDPPVNVGAVLTMEDMDITVSGPEDARVYVYSAAAMRIEDGPITGGDGNPPTLDVSMTMADFDGRYVMDGTDPENIRIDSDFSMASFAGSADVAPPEGDEGRLKASFFLSGVAGSGGGTMGNYVAALETPGELPENIDVSSDLSYDQISVEVSFRDGSDNFTGSYNNDGGTFRSAVSSEALEYAFSTENGQMQASGSDLPFPVEAALRSSDFAFSIPLAPGDGPSPFGLRVAYEEVTVSDALWSMGDPTGAIPRDPVTLIVDISGMVQLFEALTDLDPSGMMAPPGDLQSLTLNELQLSVGGAELTGQGDATFMPGQMPPVPVGSVDLSLSGANALLDRLQNSGLVPPQQIGMVRGVLGAISRPGAMPDTMESTIEFTEGGGITANGFPLQ